MSLVGEPKQEVVLIIPTTSTGLERRRRSATVPVRETRTMQGLSVRSRTDSQHLPTAEKLQHRSCQHIKSG